MKFYAIMSKRTKANTGKYPKRQGKDTMDQGAEKMKNTKTKNKKQRWTVHTSRKLDERWTKKKMHQGMISERKLRTRPRARWCHKIKKFGAESEAENERLGEA